MKKLILYALLLGGAAYAGNRQQGAISRDNAPMRQKTNTAPKVKEERGSEMTIMDLKGRSGIPGILVIQ